MSNSKDFEKLQDMLAEIDDLERACGVLEWDQMTNMPKGGAKARGHQLGTIDRLSHQKITSKEFRNLLDALNKAQAYEADSWQAGLLRMATRKSERASKVPEKMVMERSSIKTQSHQSWVKAKGEADFTIFSEDLKRSLDWQIKYAQLFEPYEHVYDPFLDIYEPGLKTKQIQDLFAGLGEKQIALVKKIADSSQVDDSFLHQGFDEDKQWEFGKSVVTDLGYDWDRGRMDKVAHPFSITLGFGDVRITNYVDPNFFNTLFFANIHETGHALYEQGLPEEFARSPLFEGASMAVHESQSRLWENFVGRSKAFWEFRFPLLQETFPTLSGIDVDTFYKGINRVKPTVIRGQADEATYNLHIMLRTKLEIEMLEGKTEVDDLPSLWNELMEEYLGITPANDAEGVLQDAHWAHGSFGYFPTYTLGNLIAAQLWKTMNSEISDIQENLRNGDSSQILAWLRENVHRHGAVFEPDVLIKGITGSTMREDDFVDYLEAKFGTIYNL